MKYWKEYNGHRPDIRGQKKKYDNTIYTFDIETTSFLLLDNNQIPPDKYLDLSEKDQQDSIAMSNMYIWMMGINEDVYYGRTWIELRYFLDRIEMLSCKEKKYCYVHNLSYEFQFLRNIFKIKKIFSRKSRKVMKCELEDFNFEFRCSYYMSGVSLEKLADIYQLNTKKLVGELDYNIQRNSKTELTTQELAYCENDCLVVYEYILEELKQYKNLKSIPLTSTGHVRKELKDLISEDYKYKNYVRNSVNKDPHIYNLLIQAFMGGYTHANWILADEIIKDVDSFDFTSSYPFCMVSYKYPRIYFQKMLYKN